MIPQLPASELARWRADSARAMPLLVDVRESWEFEYCRIDGAVSIPLGQLGRRLAEIPRDRPLVMICHHGSRSGHAALLLAQAGYGEVYNLSGGVAAWAIDVEPGMKTY